MMLNFLPAVFAATFLAFAQPVAAGEFSPVDLEPLRHQRATLVVVGADGVETSYTPAALESFTTYALTTKTPWREKAARFEGVLLSDILAAHGLGNTPILVTAENDYSTTMTRELLDSVPVMVATRVDGKAHSRRERGPIQFVIDADAATDPGGLVTDSDFVWMAARIEAAD